MKELFCIGGVAAMAQLVLCFDPWNQLNGYEATEQFRWNQEEVYPHCYDLDKHGYVQSATESLWYEYDSVPSSPTGSWDEL